MGQTEEATAAIKRYITAFNSGGAFPRDEFDAVFTANFYVTKEEYNQDFGMKVGNKYGYRTITRDEIKKAHEDHHSRGTTVTLTRCNLIAIKCLSAELKMKNNEEESTVKMVFTVKDGKIVHGREVDTVTSILRARHAHVMAMWGFSKSPHPKKGNVGDAPTLGLDQGAHPNAAHMLEKNPNSPSLGLFEGPHPNKGNAGDAPSFGLNVGPHPEAGP